MHNADAVLILGKELRRDPARAVRELRARAAGATIALRQGVPRVACLEAPLRGQCHAGSALVARFLVELGAEAHQLILAEQTRSTREEAVEAGHLARNRGWERMLVLTSAYHLPRARRYFADLPGIRCEVLAPEDLLPFATEEERAFIEAGLPDTRALQHEQRVEALFTALGTALRPLPRDLRWRIEIQAGAALRGRG